MPRDAAGNMTLVAGNPVAEGTVISPSWANPTMSDLANELTNSLDRNGRGGMLVPFQNVDGTKIAPGITFTTEPGSGLYRAGIGDIRVSIAGEDTTRWVNDSGSPPGSQQPFEIWNGATWEKVNAGITPGAYLLLTGGILTGSLAISTGAINSNFYQRTDGGSVLLYTASLDGVFRIRQASSSGTAEDTWASFNRNAGVELNYNNVKKLETSSGGIFVTGSVVASASGATAYLYAASDNGRISLSMTAAGYGLIRQFSAAGAFEDDWARFNRNASVELNYNGVKRFETSINGVEVFGILDVSGTVNVNTGGSNCNFVQQTTGGGLIQYVQASDGKLIFRQRSADGTAIEDFWIICNRNSGVQLYHNNIKKFETIVSGASITGTIKGSAQPTSSDDLTRKDYVDGLVGDVTSLFSGTSTGAIALSQAYTNFKSIEVVLRLIASPNTRFTLNFLSSSLSTSQSVGGTTLTEAFSVTVTNATTFNFSSSTGDTEVVSVKGFA